MPRSDALPVTSPRQDGTRLAWAIRDAKAPLARAIHPHDYTAVATRLAGLLLIWADSGQSDLTTMISGGSSVVGISRWRRLISRIWNAVLLVAAAIVLPLLPIYTNDHTAAAGLRYALITAAVLSVATGGAPAADTIQRNLEGTLPGAKA